MCCYPVLQNGMWKAEGEMMRFLLYISDAIIPIFLFVIVMHALFAKQNVYEDFLVGAEDGFHTVIDIDWTAVCCWCITCFRVFDRP